MTLPSIGARFVWTSKIDKKIPTRRVFVLRTWFSSHSTMSITLPSAAATIRFKSRGTVRSGSRKKATVQKISNKKISDNHVENNAATTPSSTKSAKIQRASVSVCRRIKGSIFKGQKCAVKLPKIGTEPLAAEPQYRGLRSLLAPTCSGNNLLKTTILLVVSKPFLAILLCAGRLAPLLCRKLKQKSRLKKYLAARPESPALKNMTRRKLTRSEEHTSELRH